MWYAFEHHLIVTEVQCPCRRLERGMEDWPWWNPSGWPRPCFASSRLSRKLATYSLSQKPSSLRPSIALPPPPLRTYNLFARALAAPIAHRIADRALSVTFIIHKCIHSSSSSLVTHISDGDPFALNINPLCSASCIFFVRPSQWFRLREIGVRIHRYHFLDYLPHLYWIP